MFNNRRPFHQQHLDPLKRAGTLIGNTKRDVEYQKRRGGLLPSVDRTRGPMSSVNSYIGAFIIKRNYRRVRLTLAFYPIHQQYIQGAHGRWDRTPVRGPWDATFKRKTTPGNMLLAFVSTKGSVFDEDGEEIGEPEFNVPGDTPLLQTLDEDWTIIFHGTTPRGNPFTSALTIAWRWVRDDERTFSPVRVRGAIDPVPGNVRRATGTWLWELEDVRPPRDVQSMTQATVSNHEVITIGEHKQGVAVGAFVIPALDRQLSPIVTPVSKGRMVQVDSGSAFATQANSSAGYANDDIVTYGSFGPEWATFVASGDYWEETWDTPIKANLLTLINLRPWVLYRPENPAVRITYENTQDPTVSGLEFEIPATIVWWAYGLDLQEEISFDRFRITFLGDTPVPPYGPRESGYNEVIHWRAPLGEMIQSVDMSNNPTPYHGWFAEASMYYDPPWMYIGQKTDRAISAEVYNDIEYNPWSVVGASMIIPGLSIVLPRIPYPNKIGNSNIISSVEDAVSIIVEEVKVVGSGEGEHMPAELYASGVRLIIDGQDISQYVFGQESIVVDLENWRWEDVDISQWVSSPGDHTVVLTCEEGAADVDVRIEVI